MTTRLLLPLLAAAGIVSLAACTVEQKDSGAGGAAGDSGSSGSGTSGSTSAGSAGTSTAGAAGTGTAGTGTAGTTTAGSGGTAGAAGTTTAGSSGSGTAGKGGSGGGGGSATADPCKGVSSDGKCSGTTSYQICAAPSGQGDPTLQTINCKSFETCKDSASGASCELKPGACIPGSSRCADASNREDCNNAGAWVSSACTGCTETPAGPTCKTGASKTVSGTIQYELKYYADDYSGWDPMVYQAVAPGALVMSVNAAGDLIDSAVTDVDGKFTVLESDKVQVFAMRTQDGGAQNGLRFAVIQPDVPDGKWPVSTPIPESNANFWGWEWNASDFAGGATQTITIAQGSNAMRLFDYLRFVYDSTAQLQGSEGLSLVVWHRNNTSWSCGACQQKAPVTVGGFQFDSQIWIPAIASDESYWSDAVTSHELGHWVMSSWGKSPGEGGKHYLGCPTFPGQAWSEGWATGFSTVMRGDPYYYDKQSGSFFWFNIAMRKYDQGQWIYPKASDGLLQLMDENEVSAEIWEIASHPSDPNLSLSQNKILVSSLSHPSVKSNFNRGYTRHTWDLGAGCSKTDVSDLGTAAPMFADYLDALRCNGVSAATVDGATQPNFPYPSSSPICQ